MKTQFEDLGNLDSVPTPTSESALRYRNFTVLVNKLIPTPEHRTEFITCVCAKLIADKLPLTEGDEENLENYYKLNIAIGINDYANTYNENLILDLKLLKELVRSFWMIRYTAAFSKNYRLMHITASYGTVDTMVGAGSYLSKEVHYFLNKYKKEFFNALSVLGSNE